MKNKLKLVLTLVLSLCMVTGCTSQTQHQTKHSSQTTKTSTKVTSSSSSSSTSGSSSNSQESQSSTAETSTERSQTEQEIVNKLNNWIESLTYQEKELFIDTVFNILEETGLDRFGDFRTNTTELLPVVIREFMKLSPAMQGFLFDLLKQLILASDQNIDPNAVLKTESMGETGQYDETYRPTFARPSSADRIKETELKKFEKHPEDIQDLMRKYDSMDF